MLVEVYWIYNGIALVGRSMCVIGVANRLPGCCSLPQIMHVCSCACMQSTSSCNTWPNGSQEVAIDIALEVMFSIGKTCSARILQWMNNLKEWHNNHQGGAEVIIMSFLKVVYSLKYPGNACLSYLDNGSGHLTQCTSKWVSYQNKTHE